MPDQVTSTTSGYMAGVVFHETLTASATLKSETRVVTLNAATPITATFPAPPEAGVVYYITNVSTATAAIHVLTAASGVTWDATNQSISIYPGEHIIAVSTSVTRYNVFRLGTARQMLTANGAISIPASDQVSVVGLSKAGVLAATLASPTAGVDDGKIMFISAQTANAHTVTLTAGFNAGTTGTDVATFGGAIGDGMGIVALGGVWNVLYLRNVTLA